MRKLAPTLLNISNPFSSDYGCIHQVRCVGRKLKPPDDEAFYGDIEKEIENLNKEVDCVGPTQSTSVTVGLNREPRYPKSTHMCYHSGSPKRSFVR